MKRIMKKWTHGNKKCRRQNNTKSINMLNVFTVFLLLGLTFCGVMIILALEYVKNHFEKAQKIESRKKLYEKRMSVVTQKSMLDNP